MEEILELQACIIYYSVLALIAAGWVLFTLLSKYIYTNLSILDRYSMCIFECLIYFLLISIMILVNYIELVNLGETLDFNYLCIFNDSALQGFDLKFSFNSNYLYMFDYPVLQGFDLCIPVIEPTNIVFAENNPSPNLGPPKSIEALTANMSNFKDYMGMSDLLGKLIKQNFLLPALDGYECNVYSSFWKNTCYSLNQDDYEKLNSIATNCNIKTPGTYLCNQTIKVPVGDGWREISPVVCDMNGQPIRASNNIVEAVKQEMNARKQ